MNREEDAFARATLDVLDRLPVSPGSYALRLHIAQPETLEVGKLGRFDFPAGDCIYLGSARGPGGLRARISHHLRGSTRPHWHIDALTRITTITGIWYSEGPAHLECLWSQALYALPLSVCIAPHFGAADCTHNCPAHLAAFPRTGSVSAVEWALRAVLPVGQNLHFIPLGPGPMSAAGKKIE